MRAAILEVFRVLVAVAVPLTSFTVGVKAQRPQGARLWARPSLFTRALLAVLVLVPLWGLFLVQVWPLPPATKGGLLIALVSVGIGPFATMQRTNEARPSGRDALDLNLAVLIASIVFVPVAVKVLAALFHKNLPLGVGQVAGVVLGQALVPMLLGLAAARFAPRLAALAGPRLARIATILMMLVLLLVIVATWRALIAVGVGWLACLAAALGAIAIGHALGGPDRGTRGVVAAASAMRFPALGLLLASASAQPKRIVPVVAAYALTAVAAVAIYEALMARRARRSPRTEAAPAAALPHPT